jgi:hypothetical protein
MHYFSRAGLATVVHELRNIILNTNLSLFFKHDSARAQSVLKATMSLGFSVGDFLTAIELANRIRKEFVDAPNQFKDISNE